MHPILFEVPFTGWPIRAFGVMVAAGFLVAIHIWGRLLAQHGLDRERDPERSAAVAMWCLVGVLAGGRIMYVIVESAKYLSSGDENSTGAGFVHDPLSVLYIWQGGMVMYGGFFGAVLLGMWGSKRVDLHPVNALDCGLVAAFVGQAIGRIGCLLVGDDYGSVVPAAWRDAPFPVTITVPSLEWLTANPESLFDKTLAGEVLWATQPWMSVNALAIAAVALLVLRRRRYVGQVAQWVAIHYAVTRFAIEMFRGDGVRGTWFGGALSTSQIVSIPLFLLGVVLLWKNRSRRDAVLANTP